MFEKDKYGEAKLTKKGAKTIGWGTIGVIVLIFLLCTTICIVPTGTIGVKTSFGVVSGKAGEGLNIKAPWEGIVKLNTKIQKQSFVGLTASTKDAQSISNINFDINYRLVEDKAVEIFSSVGENYQETLMNPLLTQLLKDRLALYNAEDLVISRNQIVEDITARLKESLEPYGIEIVAVSLANYDFSAQFSKALEDKAVAATEIQTAKNNQEKARIEAETNAIKTRELSQAVLMEKLIDAIKNGNGTYVIDTNNLSIGVK